MNRKGKEMRRLGAAALAPLETAGKRRAEAWAVRAAAAPSIMMTAGEITRTIRWAIR